MSEPTEPARASATGRRTVLSSAILALGAVVVAAMVGTTAEARSAAAPSNTSPPTITGEPLVGETLSATSGSWSTDSPITFAFAWLRCNAAGASCTLAGAGQTYLVANADIGFTLRVEVTATNADGVATALSEPTVVVTAPVAPANTAEPVISGSPTEGATLSTTNGTWSGTLPMTFTYQWVRCGPDGGLPDGSNCPSITGATSSSYTLTSADVGSRMRVRVTATNGAGAQTVASNATAIVEASLALGPPRNTVEPTITGTTTQGQTLSSTRGTWVGAPTITFTQQWVRCGSDGGAPDGSDCTAISGATSTSYTLTSDDVGSRMRIRVTGTNGAGVQTVASNATATVGRISGPANSTPPSISGIVATGQTLFATTGTWVGALPITYSFQWLRCGAEGGSSDGSGCTAISTGSSYAPTTADVGQRLRVRVTAQNTGGSSSAVSAPTAQVVVGAATPTPPPATPTPPVTNRPPGAVALPGGEFSIPVSSVSLPERLVIDEVEFTPNPVKSRDAVLELRVHVVDTRGYAVRDALVFARSTPVLTSPAGEGRTRADGWVSLRVRPRADFPLRDGYSVQFWIRARKQSDELLAGVSNRRLVQVATAG